MSDTVIRVENLSKRFIISHEEREPYKSLRDVMVRKTKKWIGLNKQKPHLTHEEFWALKDLNFEIKQGDRVGIIGRNGAGKSTLLKILSRITEPTQGRITIDGRVASLLEVGTGFHPELTGRENIFLNGAILGMSRAEIRAKFDEIVAFAEVEKFLDTPVKRYSSGMYVRLAFAVAAHLEPEILIVDEVLAVGDAQFQKKCLGKMEDVSKNEGRTVLFVSHDLNAVHKLCSVGVLLNNGSIYYAGAINKVIESYVSHSKNISSNYVRIGTGEIQLIDIIFLNENGVELTELSTEQAVVVKMKCKANRSMKGVQFAVCFNNIHNSRITSLWTAFKGISFDVNEGIFSLIFTIDRLGLIPGDYQILSHINCGDILIEKIDNFKFITVSHAIFSIEYAVPTLSQGVYLENFHVTLE
ncbi:MAG: ABC transporter ATP-binding protein [Bacteroidetes bacterium]|nr:ABC transporter ATP-binding protein [Bacteroidota bacterium]MBS1539742.1 ABC transporter ATP-binding protein [Bacteroidota bacterium]